MIYLNQELYGLYKNQLMRIIVSGITGFIGSHIAEVLSKEHVIVGLIHSGFNRIDEIKNNNIWLAPLGKSEIGQADVFIHCAWGGVTAAERNDWRAQAKNISLIFEMLEIANRAGCKHFIALGSQAEYGVFNGRVDETYPCKPTTAYGAAKVACSHVVEAFCEAHGMKWNWLRLFSVYGTRESINWFIPSVIMNALRGKDMELTKCEQKYDYLPAPIVAQYIRQVIETPVSGIFNLSSNGSISLKEIVNYIKKETKTTAKLNLTLPYREGQVMHMEGNSELFMDIFHDSSFPFTLNDLDIVIENYKSKL